MGFWGTLGKIAGVAAAPFTGGASLALTGISIGANVIDTFQKRSAVNNATTKLKQGGHEAAGIQAPFYNAGVAQLGTMTQLANTSHADIHKQAFLDPGYQFRFDEGQRAVERGAAAKGNLLSGGTLKDLTKYAQGAASQEYANAYQRAATGINDQYARAAGMAQAGQRAGEVQAGYLTDAASADAAGDIGRGNIWGDLIGNVANTVGGAIAGRGESSVGDTAVSASAGGGNLPSRSLNLNPGPLMSATPKYTYNQLHPQNLEPITI